MTPELFKSITTLIWQVIVIIALYKLGPYVINIIKDATQVTIKIGAYELSSSKQTSEIFIKPILNELEDAVSTLLSDQRFEFIKIYNQIYVQGENYKVPDDFVRESSYHGTLRALRNIGFIRPLQGGKWTAGKQVEVKNFGRLAAKLKAKELGFQSSPPAK